MKHGTDTSAEARQQDAAEGQALREPAPLLQFKQQLAGMSYDEQVEAIQPDLPMGVVVQKSDGKGEKGSKDEAVGDTDALFELGFSRIEEIRQHFAETGQPLADSASEVIRQFSSGLTGSLRRLQGWKESELDRTLLLKEGFETFLLAGLDTAIDLMTLPAPPAVGILAGVVFNGVTAAMEMAGQAEDNAAIRQARLLDRSTFDTGIELVNHFMGQQSSHIESLFRLFGRMEEAADEGISPENGELRELRIVQDFMAAGNPGAEELLHIRLRLLESETSRYWDLMDGVRAAIDAAAAAADAALQAAEAGFGALVDSYLQYRARSEPVRVNYSLAIEEFDPNGAFNYSFGFRRAQFGETSAAEFAPDTQARLATHTLDCLADLGLAAEAQIDIQNSDVFYTLEQDADAAGQAADGGPLIQREFEIRSARCFICVPVASFPWEAFLDTLISSCPLGAGPVAGVYTW